MLKSSELAATCKKVVRIFKIRFAHNSEIVSRDLSVDLTTKKETERKEGLYLIAVAWLVNLSLKSTQMAPALSYKEGKTKTQTRSCENWQGRQRERSCKRQRENERCFYCFLKLGNTQPCYIVSCSGLCYGAMSPQRVRTAVNIAPCVTAVSDAGSHCGQDAGY